MKVYLVTYNGYECGYGAEIFCKGIFTDERKAQEIAEEQSRFCSVTEIELDKELEHDEYLGGYIE